MGDGRAEVAMNKAFSDKDEKLRQRKATKKLVKRIDLEKITKWKVDESLDKLFGTVGYRLPNDWHW